MAMAADPSYQRRRLRRTNRWDAVADDIPEGFQPFAQMSGYVGLVGPLYERRSSGGYQVGMRIDGRHTNMHGVCHGGVLASLADVGLARVVGMSRTPRLQLVTVSLTLNYLLPAHPGDWAEVTAEIDRLGLQLGYANGVVSANGTPVLRASGVFQLLRDRPPTTTA
jgi:uncharacterized protein (TIGR00369 family)